MEQTLAAERLPLLALRGITAFPGMLLSFDVERTMSVGALNAAIGGDQKLFLVTQRDIGTDAPHQEDLFEVGTVCTVRQVLRIPGNALAKVMVEGNYRARLRDMKDETPYCTAFVERIEEETYYAHTPREEALIRRSFSLYEDYASLSSSVTPESFLRIVDSNDMGKVADYVAQNVLMKHAEKQMVLEELRPLRRIALVNRLVSREINVLALEKDLDEDTRDAMDRAQRDFYLREQMKLIRSELGDGGEDDGPEELEDYRRSLLKYRYEQNFVNQRLETAITAAQIERYYDSHKDNFQLTVPIVKARFLNISSDSPSLSVLKAKMSSEDPEDLAEADSIAYSAAMRYTDYGGGWVDAVTLSREFGKDYGQLLSSKKKGFIEEDDGKGNLSIAYVAQMIGEGETGPVEYFESRIRDIILSTRKQALLTGLERDLLDKAKRQENFEIY